MNGQQCKHMMIHVQDSQSASLFGNQLYASNLSQVRDQPMPGEDEPLHAYVEVKCS